MSGEHLVLTRQFGAVCGLPSLSQPRYRQIRVGAPKQCLNGPSISRFRSPLFDPTTLVKFHSCSASWLLKTNHRGRLHLDLYHCLVCFFWRGGRCFCFWGFFCSFFLTVWFTGLMPARLSLTLSNKDKTVERRIHQGPSESVAVLF